MHSVCLVSKGDKRLTMNESNSCELCHQSGGDIIYRHESYRVVLVDDASYPGFCRVIWNAHVKEMTDLPASERNVMMNAVWLVEDAIREVMRPDKVNIASFGNMTPHLHWHVIPRYKNDVHFPNPVWGNRQNLPVLSDLEHRHAQLVSLRQAILRRFGQG